MLFQDVNKIDLNSQNLTFLAQMFSANLLINVLTEFNQRDPIFCRKIVMASKITGLSSNKTERISEWQERLELFRSRSWGFVFGIQNPLR